MQPRISVRVLRVQNVIEKVIYLNHVRAVPHRLLAPLRCQVMVIRNQYALYENVRHSRAIRSTAFRHQCPATFIKTISKRRYFPIAPTRSGTFKRNGQRHRNALKVNLARNEYWCVAMATAMAQPSATLTYFITLNGIMILR